MLSNKSGKRRTADIADYKLKKLPKFPLTNQPSFAIITSVEKLTKDSRCVSVT